MQHHVDLAIAVKSNRHGLHFTGTQVEQRDFRRAQSCHLLARVFSHDVCLDEELLCDRVNDPQTELLPHFDGFLIVSSRRVLPFWQLDRAPTSLIAIADGKPNNQVRDSSELEVQVGSSSDLRSLAITSTIHKSQY